MATTTALPQFTIEISHFKNSTPQNPASKAFDAGITSLPPIFMHPNLTLSPSPNPRVSIPFVDLSLLHSTAVDLIGAAAESFGFFLVINHSIPLPLIHRSISAVRFFNELPLEIRSQFYSREIKGGVSYASNFNLLRFASASWRDTIQIRLGPTKLDPDRIPPVCREELLAYGEHVKKAGRAVMGMLAEGLGVEKGRLEEMSCCEDRVMVSQYYPWCPGP